jgi:hypothetical protein
MDPSKLLRVSPAAAQNPAEPDASCRKRLGNLVRLSRTATGLDFYARYPRIGWSAVERGDPVDENQLTGVEQILGWPVGTAAAVLRGEPVPGHILGSSSGATVADPGLHDPTVVIPRVLVDEDPGEEPAEEDERPARRPVRIELSAGGHQVVIEAPEPMRDVAALALELWHAVDSPDVSRSMGAAGFDTGTAERAGLMPSEADLPERLVPAYDDGDRRRSAR